MGSDLSGGASVGVAGLPGVGEPVFLVVVRCGCPDRWWAQPEGGHFPVCQSCGAEARPVGYVDAASGDEWRRNRVRSSLGVAGHVLGEFAALRAAQALRNDRAQWEVEMLEGEASGG